jgi:acetyl esterase
MSTTHASRTVPLDPAIAQIGPRWKAADIPGLYDGCNLPSGGPVCRERARNVRGFFYPKPVLDTGRVEYLVLDGPHGPIPIQIVWPHERYVSARPSSTLVYFHGGGWVVGDLDSHSAHAIRLANEARCVVVNVDYRLAPEFKFPVPVDDCWFATQWALKNIDRLGNNKARFAVGGDSAGGNFAAVMALLCRDHGIALAAQLLMYPATDATKIGEQDIREAYFHDHASESTDFRASPLLASSHKGLAPTILGVGPYDFLYQDNLAYMEVLKAAGVPLLYRDYPSLNHGFFSYTAISKDSEQAAIQLCHDLREHFERTG